MDDDHVKGYVLQRQHSSVFADAVPYNSDDLVWTFDQLYYVNLTSQ